MFTAYAACGFMCILARPPPGCQSYRRAKRRGTEPTRGRFLLPWPSFPIVLQRPSGRSLKVVQGSAWQPGPVPPSCRPFDQGRRHRDSFPGSADVSPWQGLYLTAQRRARK